ncbi:hypothetical protein LJC08_05780 [Methanimicrococcus sp. OttesenSCG-928-J09]|nr:hypothetical protein [Methanimicrococcus sp. OttesenSCG-928-J09]
MSIFFKNDATRARELGSKILGGGAAKIAKRFFINTSLPLQNGNLIPIGTGNLIPIGTGNLPPLGNSNLITIGNSSLPPLGNSSQPSIGNRNLLKTLLLTNLIKRSKRLF